MIFNSTWAALSCLTRTPLEDFLPVLNVVGPSVLEFLEEVALIGWTANLPLPSDFAQKHFDATVEQRKKGGRHRPSALVDVLTGRPFEVECEFHSLFTRFCRFLTCLPPRAAATVGAVLALGRRVGVEEKEMKTLRLVYGLASVIQRSQLGSQGR